MPAAVRKFSFECEQLLYQAAVDSEFRAEFVKAPARFGIELLNLSLPDSVEQQDQAALKAWSDGLAAVEVYACQQSCSYGPFTIACDGMTK